MQQNHTILYSSYLATPLGRMLVITDEQFLYLLKFHDDKNLSIAIELLSKKLNAQIITGKTFLFQKLEQEMNDYFAGNLQQFTIPLSLQGTQFQQKNWQALLLIPYGSTTSYACQAAVTGNPRAYRAVANANGKNLIAIIIPCHRIIKSNGDLCGYNSGIHRKKALLTLEKKYRCHTQL